MKILKMIFLPAVLLLAAVVLSGCSSPTLTPTPTPQPSVGASTPQEAVIGFWQAIDKGDYSQAYDLAYPIQNVSRQQWMDQHRAMWGDNGANIQLYNFTVIQETPMDPAMFSPGNFTDARSILVNTTVSYYGKTTTSISQFAAVKLAGDGWKFYGSY